MFIGIPKEPARTEWFERAKEGSFSVTGQLATKRMLSRKLYNRSAIMRRDPKNFRLRENKENSDGIKCV